jgi:hypothetical protein
VTSAEFGVPPEDVAFSLEQAARPKSTAAAPTLYERILRFI